MDGRFEMRFPLRSFGRPYEKPEEYLDDWMGAMELTVEDYLRFRGDGAAPGAEEAQGSAEEVRRDALRVRERAELWIESRRENSGCFFAADYLCQRFGLDALERFTLLLSLLPRYDESWGGVFARLQGDSERTLPGCALALALFDFRLRAADCVDAQPRLQALRERCRLLLFTGREGELDPCLADFLLQNGQTETLPAGVRLRVPAEAEEPPALAGPAERMAEQIGRYRGDDLLVFHLHAPFGAGGRTQAGLAAARRDRAVLHADLPLEEDEAWALAVCRQALLQRAWPCFTIPAAGEGEQRLDRLWELARQFTAVAFLRTAPPLRCGTDCPGVFWLECELPPPDRDERLALWAHYTRGLPLADLSQLDALADRFRFLPGQIAAAARSAEAERLWRGEDEPLDRETMNRCALAQAAHTLDRRATRLRPGGGWDELILEDREKRMLEHACDRVRLRHKVYGAWGFERRVTYGRGVSMLFAGPPGTGKTMAAQVAARALELELYKVDLSQVVSKYIGETEKNLSDLFDEAWQSGAALLFDETDALLGKRTEVKDSHDKNANMETSYLLQRMEEYEGVTMLTTNYLENIDPAFFRRISYVIHFPFPDEDARRRLWRGMFPAQTPMDGEIDFDYLARQFELAGGSIKNAALSAAFLAAGQERPVGMVHIVKALQYELAKQGKVLLAEDFGEYSYLMNREV